MSKKSIKYHSSYKRMLSDSNLTLSFFLIKFSLVFHPFALTSSHFDFASFRSFRLTPFRSLCSPRSLRSLHSVRLRSLHSACLSWSFGVTQGENKREFNQEKMTGIKFSLKSSFYNYSEREIILNS